MMGQAWPNSDVVGFDYHDGSIAARPRGRPRRAWATGSRSRSPGPRTSPAHYDLICLFDCLHDMGDPVGAARHVREALRPGGTCCWSSRPAADRPEDNHHPLGRLFYAASTADLHAGVAGPGRRLGLGNQAGIEPG